MAALHREKLRTFLTKPEVQAPQVCKKLDLDYDTMEYKSILPTLKADAAVIGNAQIFVLLNLQFSTHYTFTL